MVRARPRSESGAALVEAALVLPVLMVFLLGIIEFGLAYASGSTTTASSRSGARLAATSYATAGSASSAQRSAADQIAAAAAADLKALNNATPVGMVIYKVNPSSGDGAPSGGFPGPNLSGGCSSNCFRYTWNPATRTMEYSSGGWPNPDACGATVDSIGVYVQVEHRYLTQLIGESRSIGAHTVMRLEPLPTDLCGGTP
jgi:hypothetical protein